MNTGAFDAADRDRAAAAAQRRLGPRGRRLRPLGRRLALQRHLTAGLELADSWATDAHKWLNVPYDSGLVFVREPRHLHAAMSSSSAAYLIESETRDPHLTVPEISRRARGVEVWARSAPSAQPAWRI